MHKQAFTQATAKFIAAIMIVMLALAALPVTPALAAVVVTGASGGVSISADTTSAAWTTLGTITIAEAVTTDFSAGTSVTLILKAPLGFEFNTAVTPSITFTGDITSASVTMTDSSTITITLTVSGTGLSDTLTIGSTTGIQVRPTAGTPLATGKHIYRPTSSGGTAVIAGITANASGSGGSNFGDLTEVAGAATKLAFTTQPGGGTGGTVWLTAVRPVVTVQDQFGNKVTTDTSTVTVALLFNAGLDGILSGTLTKTAVAGVASFSGNGLTIDKIGDGYKLVATDGSLTSATSNAFNITTGPAKKLVYTTVPSTGTAGTAFSVTVQSQDAGGNPASLASDTTITLSKATGAGTLSGTLTGSIGSGANSVTIATPVYSKSDTMTLTATASGGDTLTAVTSGAIVFSAGAATKLAYTAVPSTGTAGTAFSVTVQSRDANGNPANLASDTTITLSNPTGAGTLSGTLTGTIPTNANSVTIATPVYSKSDTMTLTATASGGDALTAVTSGAIVFSAGAATKLVVKTQPSPSTVATVAFAQQPVVTIEDASGNTVTTGTASTRVVTVSLTTGTGALAGTLTKTAVAGVADFSGQGLAINLAGTDKVLTFTTTGGVITSTTSSPAFTITVGAATKLAYTTVPSTGTAGTAFSVTVQSQDAGGNPANLASDTTITLSKAATGAGTLSGTLTGTILTSANSVTIATPVYSKSDTMKLTATASGGVTLTAVTSANIVFSAGTATQLAFTTQPGGGTGGTAWATQPVVTVQDANGNTVTTDTSTVTVAILNNAGPGGVLSGTSLTRAAVAGVANFSTRALKIDKSGTGYTLTATDGSLTSATSNAFDITTGTATKLAYTTVPATGTAGTAFSVTVQSQDLGGNPANLASDTTITLSKAATGAGTLSGTLTGTILTSANSVTIATPVYSKSDTMRLTATASDGDTLTAVTSVNIVFSAGAATKLAFTTQPVGGTGGAGLPEQSVVTVQDQFGNTVKTDTSTVTMAILFNAGPGGILSGTLTKAAVAGVADFSGNGLTIDKIGTGYTLVATDGSLTSATSNAFDITTGAAAKLAYTTVPSTGTAGTTFSVTVQSQDLGGNPASPASDTTITLSKAALGAGTLSGTLTGTIPTSANSVTIATPVYSKSDTMTLTATASGGDTLTAVTSGDIVFSAGTATKLIVTLPGQTFTSGSGNSGTVTAQTAGTAFDIVSITATDADFNTVTSYSGSKTISYTGPGGTPTYATAVSFTSGQSTTMLATTLTKAETTTITASDGTTTGPASSSLTVNAAALNNFLVETAGGGGIAPQTAGTAFNIKITARDAYNNTVTGFTGTVQITSSGVLSGAPVTSGSFVGGVLTSQSVTITSAQLETTLSATESGSGANGSSNGFTVNPAGINFLVEASGGGDIGPQTVGAGFGIKITARNPDNSTKTDFTGTVNLSSTAGTISPISVTFGSGDNGVVTISNVTLTQAGTNRTITATSGSDTGTSNDFTVNAAGSNFLVEASGGGDIGPQTVGAGFGIRITARNPDNSIATGFTGTVNLSSTAGTISPSSVIFGSGDFGVVTISNVTLTQAGTNKTITATSGSDTGTSNAFTVNGGGFFAKLQILVPGETAAPGTSTGKTGTPNAQTAGTPFPVTVNAVDDGWNVVTSTDTVHLSSDDGAATLPSDAALVAGTKTFSVTLNTAGTAMIIASDITTPSKTPDMSPSITVNAGAADATASTLTPASASITADGTSTQVLTVTAKDAHGNNVGVGGATVTITKSSGTGSIGAVTDVGDGTYTATVTAPSLSGSGVFVATLGGSPVKGGTGSQTQATVTYVAVVVAANAAHSTISASPTSITADGSSTSTITLQARDVNNTNLTTGGATVVISKSSGTGTLGSTTDNENGTYTATLTAPTAAGSATLAATLDGTAVGTAVGVSSATVTYVTGTGPVSKLVVTLPGQTFIPGVGNSGTVTAQTAGMEFHITSITATDADFNTVTSYSGSKTISYTGPGGRTSYITSVNFTSGQSTTTLATTLTKAETTTITASDGTTTGPASSSLTVNAGALNNFLVEAAGGGGIAPQTAGTAFNIKITERDAYNNTVTGFTGTVQITSSGVLSGAPVTSGSFVAGVLTSQSVTITSAQSGTTLSATESGGGANGTSNGFTVNPAGTNFLVEASGGGDIGPQTVGAGFGIRITARNPDNSTKTDFTGTVDLSSTAGTISPISVTFLPGNLGVATISNVTLTQAGTNRTITATSGSDTGTSNDFTVNAAGSNFLVEALGGGDIGPQTVGAGFGIRITARNPDNSTKTGFSGTVNLSSTAGTISPISVIFGSGDNGVVTISNVALTQAGTNKTITATSGSYTGTSNDFTVHSGGPFTRLQILVPGETAAPGTPSGKTGTPAAQTEGTPFTVTVNAVDDNWNMVSSTDAVHIDSTDGAATLPTDAELVAGTKTFSVTLNTEGTATITVSDITTPAKTPDTSSSITVNEGVGDAAQSTLTPVSASIMADGTSTQVLTVTAKSFDRDNVGVGGATVTITKFSGTGSIGAVTDVGDGTYTATVTAPTLTGSGVFVATLGGQPVKSRTGSQTRATVTYVAGAANAAHSTISASPTSITANGSSTSTITVQARDVNNNNLTTGGAAVVISKSAGTGTLGSTTDNGNGTYTATLTAPTAAGSATLAATLGGTAVGTAVGASSATVTYVAGTVAKLIVTLPGQTFTSGVGNSGTVTAQTAGTAFNLTLTAVDASNNTNGSYSGTKTISYSGPGGTPTYTTSVTFTNGQATSVSTTLTKAEVTTITASDGTMAGLASSSLTVNAGGQPQQAVPIPTLTEWGMLIMALLLAGVAGVELSRSVLKEG